MRKTIIAVILGLSCQMTSAKTIFSCFTKSGKHLSVEQVGSKYHYSYGKPGKPEMKFSNSKRAVDNSLDWTGNQVIHIVMENKGIEYLIWNTLQGEYAGGVEVSKNGKTFERQYCNPSREIYGLHDLRASLILQ